MFTAGAGDSSLETEEEDVVEKPAPTLPRTSAILEFTILGLKRGDIDAVKAEIEKCCSEEAADKYISGPEFSDIIQCLDEAKVNIFVFTACIHVTWDK